MLNRYIGIPIPLSFKIDKYSFDDTHNLVKSILAVYNIYVTTQVIQKDCS